jgi:hypothetical protein
MAIALSAAADAAAKEMRARAEVAAPSAHVAVPREAIGPPRVGGLPTGLFYFCCDSRIRFFTFERMPSANVDYATKSTRTL